VQPTLSTIIAADSSLEGPMEL